MEQKNYYPLSVKQALAGLGSSPEGLQDSEAAERLKKFGLNEFPASRKRRVLGIFLSQLDSPFVLILIAAAVIAFFLGERIDAAIILGMVALTSWLGFFQEFKSEKALQHLRKLVSFNAKALRGGKETEIDVKQLVPGDIVFLEIGDIVPADARVISAEDFSCNESALTGEAEPAEKNPAAISAASPVLSELKNIVFMGTSVASGRATVLVAGTGYGTELGRTAHFLKDHETISDFEINLSKFGGFLIYVIVAMTLFIFFVNAWLGKGLLDSFLFSLALAVGITPEALPIIITIGLSRGAVELSKKKVVVKRLSSIENLGNMDVLCCDKTGTLTENDFSLHSFFDVAGRKEEALLLDALLCNSAVKTKKRFVGNRLDVALWEFAEKNYSGIEKKISHFSRIGELEFDFERRRMGAIVQKNGSPVLICKGSFDSIMSASSTVDIAGKVFPLAAKKFDLEHTFSGLGNSGYRVIAIASKAIAKKKEYSKSDEAGLCFKGFLVFFDPPKKIAAEAIASLQFLGVALKVITGDNALVTREVCRQVGFKIANETIIDGAALSSMDAALAKATILQNNVFVRVSPEQKLQIVSALRQAGHVVGFLGDGINDADALKAADVGITVDSAVDIARESADIILLKKSLLVIDEGIKEGRRTFGNMIKYIFNTISANFGNMFTLAISSLFLPFLPLLPTQILLTNFLSDGPMLMISTDSVDREYLQKPRRWSIKAISRFMVFFGLISSVFDLVTIAFLLFVLFAGTQLFQTAWFLESVLSEIIVTFAIRTKRPFWKSTPSKWLLISTIIIVLLSVGVIYSPWNSFFGFVPLPAWFLGIVFFILVAYFSIVEIAKGFFFRKFEI